MAKKKKKKQRAGEKEKKNKKKALNERETVSYEQQILDNNRQLARLRSRNKDLEEEVETANENLRQLEEDRSDVVAHLSRNLEEKIEETRELNERLSALEELRKEELKAFKKKEDAMELEYRTMESNLTAEVKLAAGKLNALEDWRLARLDLMQKFEQQEKEIEDQEERHRRTLYEAEKSLIIGKARMQREMEDRLRDLSKTLDSATNVQIADATHRAVRENVALNRDLDVLLDSYEDLEAAAKEFEANDRVLRLQSALFETESKISLKKSLDQKRRAEKLAEEIVRLNFLYGKAKRENARFLRYREIAEECEERRKETEGKIRELEEVLRRKEREKEEILRTIEARDEEFGRLKGILDRSRDCVKQALLLKEEDYADEVCPEILKQRLLLSLREILEQEDIVGGLGRTASEMERIKCAYTRGSLGLIRTPEVPDGEKKTVEKSKKKEEDAELEEKSTEAEEWRPSCLSSDVSLDVFSPKEASTESMEEDEEEGEEEDEEKEDE